MVRAKKKSLPPSTVSGRPEPAGPDGNRPEETLIDHRDVLESYLKRRLRSHEDHEDYIQDVFCRILAMNEEQRSLVKDWRGFIVRTASNLIIDQFRKRKSRHADMHVELEEGLAIMDEYAFDPERAAMGREQLAAVDTALSHVDDLARRTLIAARVHGRSHADIAKEYGISTKKVGHLIERALRQLARQLASDGDD